jgi:hypothetical protein
MVGGAQRAAAVSFATTALIFPFAFQKHMTLLRRYVPHHLFRDSALEKLALHSSAAVSSV